VSIGTLCAAEFATVVLVDGERLSGSVTSRDLRDSRGRDLPAGGDLSLLTDDGREIGVPLDRLAAIQFDREEPSSEELLALPGDNSHVIVRRNGLRESGQFVGIGAGDTVRWQSRNGREQLISFRELSRIYLNPGRARAAFAEAGRFNPSSQDGRDQRGATRTDPGFQTDSERGFRTGRDQRRFADGTRTGQSIDVRVDASQLWTDTAVRVRAGDLLVFRASGRINFGHGETQNAGPEGNDSLKLASYPVSGAPVGSLIGRVGNSAPFLIGANAQPIQMPSSGILMLGVNDDQIGDNSGVFTVVITQP